MRRILKRLKVVKAPSYFDYYIDPPNVQILGPSNRNKYKHDNKYVICIEIHGEDWYVDLEDILSYKIES